MQGQAIILPGNWPKQILQPIIRDGKVFIGKDEISPERLLEVSKVIQTLRSAEARFRKNPPPSDIREKDEKGEVAPPPQDAGGNEPPPEPDGSAPENKQSQKGDVQGDEQSQDGNAQGEKIPPPAESKIAPQPKGK